MNQELKEYVIKNAEIELRAINYGASVTAIKVKDRDGNFENILASFDDLNSYLDYPDPYLNAIVGPTAGRIAYGEYRILDNDVKLSINNGKHHLHGGSTGISRQYFEVEEIVQEKKKILRFTLETNHDIDGLTGKYYYEADYIIEGNTLTMKTRCTPEKPAIINMTSHMYFNLSGELKSSIKKQLLKLPAKEKLVLHEDGHPYRIDSINKGSAFDFSELTVIEDNYSIGDEEFKISLGYDVAFILEDEPIILMDEESGRIMNIDTDQKCVVVYSANYFDESLILNNKIKGYPFSCIALETQDIPNGINIDGIETKVYDKDNPYTQETIYTFYVDEK